MNLACVDALAQLARDGAGEEVARAYGDHKLKFGRDYLLPRPFDPRLLGTLAPAVAEAAMRSGVASRPVPDMPAYRAKLSRFIYRSSFLLRPVFEAARKSPRRVIFAEGEDERVLRAMQAMLDEGIAIPIATGRPDRIARLCATFGLRIAPDRDFEVFNPEADGIAEEFGSKLHALRARDGIGPDLARRLVRSDDTLAAAMRVREGDAECVICGTLGAYLDHLRSIAQVLPRTGPGCAAALAPLIMDAGTVFIADGYVNYEPSAQEIAEICRMAAGTVSSFGLAPRVALISHANFGTNATPSATRMRRATEILSETEADFEFEGEMRLDLAFDKTARDRFLPAGRLTDRANILVFPSIDSANAAINALRTLANALPVGPILMGYGGAAHIVTSAVTARGLLNVAAIASAMRG